MTVLMISPYAPYRDGIANYAVQEVAAGRARGEDIEVLSPLPSAAHHHLVIGSPRGMARLLRFVAGYERVIIQAYPELLFGSCRTRIERAVSWSLLGLIARRVPTELRVHEIDYQTVTSDRLTRSVATRALRSMDQITVHTAAEQRALLEAIGSADAVVELVEHGKDFVPRTSATREDARESLGIPPEAHVFVSIGFVQRHKGFDRGVRAFARIRDENCRLYVAGDIRVDHPDLVAYRDELDRLIDATPGAERRAGYLSDEEFDRWLIAADTLVLPYREIWSSSVIERAALFHLPVIATRVGGLGDQALADTVLVDDDRQLAEAMAAAIGRHVELDARDLPDRTALEATMRSRAGTSAPTAGEAMPSDHLHRAERAHLGHPTSERPGAGLVKRLVQRLTAWQMEPMIRVVNDLIDATTEAVEALERDADGTAPGDHVDPGTGP